MILEIPKSEHRQLSEHFNSREWNCHCSVWRRSCNVTYIDTDLIEYLEIKRLEIGKPITITSGFRCTYHNKKCGGAPGSQHLVGKAADIVIVGANVLDYAEIFEDASGLGRYPTLGFLHIDIRRGWGNRVVKSRWIEL